MAKKDGPNRRQLIQGGAALGAGMLIGGSALGDAIAAPGKAKLRVPRKVLGKTGKKVPILVFGSAMSLDPVFDPKIAEAVRYGVDYIDAAAVYGGGTCEPAVGAYHTRAKNRDKLWITSKSPRHDLKGFSDTLDNSLEDLKTDYIDLYFLHALREVDYLSTSMGVLAEKLKKQGKIRHIGFSCHHGNVAELLQAASKRSWIDVIMFRYNFRQYGDKQLNKAMDAAAKAGIGLIAMKTQGSAASFADEWKKFTKSGKWNKHQAVLKAVWADDRITAAVSHMDTLKVLRENIGAAVDKTKLTRAELESLDRYAAATRAYACDGCDHICGAQVAAPIAVGDTLRFLMYSEVYGEHDKARKLFAALAPEQRALDGVDFGRAAKACPHGFDLAGHMERAKKILV